MTTTTTLTIPAGGQAGPFDLYSDVDSYADAFATGILPATMILGYTSSDVPNGTNFIRVQSTTTCENYIDIPVTTDITIGTQTFLNKNLDTTTYTDGTEIPQVTNDTAWENLKTGAWCYYNNDPANGPIYGKLYNWYALNGIHVPESTPPTPAEIAARKTLAPAGYHVPVYSEMTTLKTYLESVISVSQGTGNALKSTGTIGNGGLWEFYAGDTIGIDLYGFTAVPGGIRYVSGSSSSFQNKGNNCSFATKDIQVSGGTGVGLFKLSHNTGTISLSPVNEEAGGYSVRLIKN